jgi:hypothetical protein
MLKITLIFVCYLGLLGCKPANVDKTDKEEVKGFICLASQSSCVVDTNIGQFSIEFSGDTEQGKLKTELPFRIQLTATDKENLNKLVSIESYLEGKTMFMGKVPVFFEQDTLRAETLLASCSEDIMTWRLWLMITMSNNGETIQQEIYIDFDSIRL